jgi:hypothetical protein
MTLLMELIGFFCARFYKDRAPTEPSPQKRPRKSLSMASDITEYSTLITDTLITLSAIP